METQKVVEDMLKENTGKAMCDSGDYYGRHWQSNQERDFEKEPETTLSFKDGYIELTHNVYHWLNDRIAYNEDLDKRFVAFAAKEEDKDSPWLQVARDFVDTIEGAAGIYRDGEPMVVNTYNGEDLLSQTIQYIYWTDDDGAHVLLQIHGGCDARGGYTQPRAFDANDYDGTAIFNNADASIGCSECGKYWHTDDGYHYYEDGACGGDYRQLEELSIIVVEPSVIIEARAVAEGRICDEKKQMNLLEKEQEDEAHSRVATYALGAAAEFEEKDNPGYKFWMVVAAIAKPGTSLVVNEENGEALCPVCGKGTLSAGY